MNKRGVATNSQRGSNEPQNQRTSSAIPCSNFFIILSFLLISGAKVQSISETKKKKIIVKAI